MKHLVKSLVPEPLRQALRQRRARRDWGQLMSAWDAARTLPRPDAPGACKTDPGNRRILIFPSDLGKITGALGDDAMISATVEQARARLGPVAVDMVGLPGAQGLIAARGFTPVALPAAAQFPARMAALMRTRRYAAVVVLGADILDGYYNPTAALLRLICADLAARAGLPATILGASFNARPAPGLKPAFEALDPAVHLNMRDAVSRGRITGFAQVDARLVADCAFALTPGTADPDAVAWIDAQRAQGRRVLGLNVHPMLIRGATPAQVDRIIRTTIQAVTAASAAAETGAGTGADTKPGAGAATDAKTRTGTGSPTSWLMIPHDYRGERGDARCLRPIHAALSAAHLPSFYLNGEHRAADLKALAGCTDGVVTGRMHLAIAALGMGVPTLCLTYQDKFEGLYRHFDLPGDLLLAPDVFDDAAALSNALRRFGDALPMLSAQVAARKPEIRRLAGLNFDVMGPITEPVSGACNGAARCAGQ